MALRLGASTPTSLEGPRAPRGQRHALTSNREEPVNLAVLNKAEIVYIEKLEAPNSPTASRAGSRLPLHCTALGKAMLAFSPLALSDQIIQNGLAAVTERSITSVATFRRELAAVRTTRLAFDREELAPGLFCIGTPIFDSRGALLGAISVSSLESIMGARTLGPALLTISRALSREFNPQPLKAEYLSSSYHTSMRGNQCPTPSAVCYP